MSEKRPGQGNPVIDAARIERGNARYFARMFYKDGNPEAGLRYSKISAELTVAIVAITTALNL